MKIEDIPISVTSEPYGSVPCIKRIRSGNVRVAFITENNLIHACNAHNIKTLFLGNWRTREAFRRFDKESFSFENAEHLVERLKEDLRNIHKEDLKNVAAGFEISFGIPPAYLLLQLCDWRIMPKSDGYLLSTQSSVAAFDKSLNNLRTSWDEIPGIPYAPKDSLI